MIRSRRRERPRRPPGPSSLALHRSQRLGRKQHDKSTSQSSARSNDPERLPLRWGVILMAAVCTGAAAFIVGGPLAAIGVAGFVVSTLHKVLA